MNETSNANASPLADPSLAQALSPNDVSNMTGLQRLERVEKILQNLNDSPPPLPDASILFIEQRTLRARMDALDSHLSRFDRLDDTVSAMLARLAVHEFTTLAAPTPFDAAHQTRRATRSFVCGRCHTEQKDDVSMSATNASEKMCPNCGAAVSVTSVTPIVDVPTAPVDSAPPSVPVATQTHIDPVTGKPVVSVITDASLFDA